MIRTQGTWLLLCLMLLGRVGEAGQRIGSPAADGSSTAQAEPLDLPFAFDGPPAPVPPEVIARDAASGRATVRAVRLTAPLRIDGRLDEAVYTSVRSMSDFIQQDPQEGARASEKTEAWLFFDRDRVYVSFRCWESHPERLVATEMRRDNPTVFTGNDNIAFILDTFYDRRNSDFFTINPIGGRSDGQVTNERQYNADWNPDLGSRGRAIRGRMDGRSGHPVQVAALPAWPGPDLGLQRAPHQPLEERDVVPHARAGVARHRGHHAGIAGSHGGRAGGAGGLEEPGAQAVRHLGSDERSRGHAEDLERAGRRRRGRSEVRPHAEPDGRLHLQHRFRAGRGRRAAGQSHAVQPVLPGEARVLPRESGDVRLWRRRRPAPGPAATRRRCSTAGGLASIRVAPCRSLAADV